MEKKPAVRITDSMRSDIADAIYERALVAERKAMKKEIADFCLEVLHKEFLKQPAVDELRAVAAKYPGFIQMKSGTRFEFHNDRGSGAVTLNVSWEKDMPTPVHHWAYDVKRTTYFIKAQELAHKELRLMQRWNDVRNTARNTLQSFTTIAKLRAAMPELDPYLKAEWKDPPKKLPQVDCAGFIKTLTDVGSIPV
jgi:hypothetical protein